MAGVTGTTIAASYDQMVILDNDGGGNTSTLVALKDGDGGTDLGISVNDASTGQSVLKLTGSHASGTELRLDNTATTGDVQLAFQLDGTSAYTMGIDDDDGDKLKIGTTACSTATFMTMVNGKVGIHGSGSLDADPVSLLEIHDDSAHPILTITAEHANAYDPQIQFRSDATEAVKYSCGVDSNDNSFVIAQGTGGVGGADTFKIDASGNVGINQAPGYQFEVTADAPGSGTAVARFNHDGSTDGQNNPILVLKYGNSALATPDNTESFIDFCIHDNSIIDDIRGDNAGGVESTMSISSDRNIKENIKDLTGALDTINKLKPKSYNYTDDYLNNKLQRTTSKPWWKDINAGFNAQEFSEIFPVLTRTRNETVQEDGISYAGKTYNKGDKIPVEMIDLTRDQVMASYIVGAIQELSAKVTALENA